MFGYNPQSQNNSGQIQAQGMISDAQLNAQRQMQMAQIQAEQARLQQAQQRATQQDIGSALSAIGGMYGKFKNKKDTLAGMDGSVSAMSDMGAVTADFRDKYMNAPENVRPFLFYNVASPMLNSFSAGQTAAAQAQAWDQYKSKWGADAGGGNKYGYSYQGP